jgi:hypothetical protein
MKAQKVEGGPASPRQTDSTRRLAMRSDIMVSTERECGLSLQ